MSQKSYTLLELATFLGATFSGDGEKSVDKVQALDRAGEDALSYYYHRRYYDHFMESKAGILIVKTGTKEVKQPNILWVDDPYLAYAKVSKLFTKEPVLQVEVAKTAILDEGVVLGEQVAIGHHVVLGKGVCVGSRVIIEAGCVVGDDCVIEEDSHLYPNVTLYYGSRVGKRVIIHSGAVIGADGFGNANEGGVWQKIHQLGGVEIQDDVEIGANTCIDRGALDDTVIGLGVKIDNQVQIAHNVKIGDHSAVAGCVGIAGSTEIGKHCLIGGGVGISGHLKIADGVILTAMTGVSKSIMQAGIYASGFPAFPHRTWWRLIAIFSRLDVLVKKLETPSRWRRWWERAKWWSK